MLIRVNTILLFIVMIFNLYFNQIWSTNITFISKILSLIREIASRVVVWRKIGWSSIPSKLVKVFDQRFLWPLSLSKFHQKFVKENFDSDNGPYSLLIISLYLYVQDDWFKSLSHLVYNGTLFAGVTHSFVYFNRRPGAANSIYHFEMIWLLGIHNFHVHLPK